MIGTINFFGTHIGAWEETTTREFVAPGVYERFRATLARLRDHRGFRVHQDTSVHKLIRRGHYLGRKGDLEFHAEAHGRTFAIEFFQNVNIKNRNGGRYDFDKFERMPRTMQLACAVEMSHVLRKLIELGYVLEGTRQGITSAGLLPVLRHAQGRTDEGDPLMQFNRSWNFESDWKRGGRFDRDESGWPTVKAVCCGVPKDRDGQLLVSGETMYCRRKGGLFRGVARPAPNGGWVLIAHGRSVHVDERELFRCDDPSAEPRRLVPGQLKRVRAELEKALKASAYDRVEALARVARKLEASQPPRVEGRCSMTTKLTLEEWGALTSCLDDGAPPTEARFPKTVYDGLVARGLMRHRIGKLPDGGDADFWLTLPAGEVALKDCEVMP